MALPKLVPLVTRFPITVSELVPTVIAVFVPATLMLPTELTITRVAGRRRCNVGLLSSEHRSEPLVMARLPTLPPVWCIVLFSVTGPLLVLQASIRPTNVEPSAAPRDVQMACDALQNVTALFPLPSNVALLTALLLPLNGTTLYEVAIYSGTPPPENVVKLSTLSIPLRETSTLELRLVQLTTSVFRRRRPPTMPAILGQAPFAVFDRTRQVLYTIPPIIHRGRVVEIRLVMRPVLATRTPQLLLLFTNTTAPRYVLLPLPLVQPTAPLITTPVLVLSIMGNCFMLTLSPLMHTGWRFLLLLSTVRKSLLTQ